MNRQDSRSYHDQQPEIALILIEPAIIQWRIDWLRLLYYTLSETKFTITSLPKESEYYS